MHKKCSGLKRLTNDPDYRCIWCQGTARPLDGRPHREVRRTWQAGSASFLLLPTRHALSSRWLWPFNHNTCENNLEEVQRAATSSLFLPPLFQDTWPRVQLLCGEHNAPCQWDLATDNAKPPTSAAKWQGNDQTDLQCQAARHYHHQIQLATCAAWHWGSGPHSEGEKALLVWTWLWNIVKTAFDIQVDGKREPGRLKMMWKQLTARNYREWKLLAINPHNRHTWRSDVRSAIPAASQLSGREPTDVDVALVPARLSKIWRRWWWITSTWNISNIFVMNRLITCLLVTISHYMLSTASLWSTLTGPSQLSLNCSPAVNYQLQFLWSSSEMKYKLLFSNQHWQDHH